MLIDIDLGDGSPLYLQIAAGIRGALATGRLAAGERLPTGRELAGALDVNLETVQRAYRVVAEEGLIVTRVGRGTRVVDEPDIDLIDVRRHVTELVARAAEVGVSAAQLADMVRAEGG